MEIIFIISGTNGEYSDCVEWNVAAYTSREAAEQHLKLLNEHEPQRIADRPGMRWV